MENNKQKERIRKNIKEEIAISNIRKEFAMKSNKNKRIVYTISSICAVFILGIGILVGTSRLNNNLSDNIEIGEKEESLDVEININKIQYMEMVSLDTDVEIVDMNQLPDEFTFMENVSIPEGYNLEDSYIVYTRESIEIEEYNILHDYILNYRKDDSNNITIAFSGVEQPIRDYYIEEGKKISKIGDVELNISQWEEMYIVTFEYKGIYFDIETTGITEEQLVSLLKSIIEKV